MRWTRASEAVDTVDTGASVVTLCEFRFAIVVFQLAKCTVIIRHAITNWTIVLLQTHRSVLARILLAWHDCLIAILASKTE